MEPVLVGNALTKRLSLRRILIFLKRQPYILREKDSATLTTGLVVAKDHDMSGTCL
jgi:hypothetical protein